MKEMMDKTMTKPEYELKRAEEDMIVENAEVCVYLMLIQQCQMAGGVYSNAIAPLSKNMNDEQEQADWLKTTSPAMLAQLWPKIQSSVVANAPPFSLITKKEIFFKMKALVYHGPYDVRIDDKPHPTIQHPEDAILRITSTAICGSDLHLYHGTVPGMQPGQTLGHEFMGVIEEIGPEVQDVQVGDRVVIPFNVNCGRCRYCNNNMWSQCDRANPKTKDIGAAYGYTQLLGGYDGGQAEYVTCTICKCGSFFKSSRPYQDRRAGIIFKRYSSNWILCSRYCECTTWRRRCRIWCWTCWILCSYEFFFKRSSQSLFNRSLAYAFR